MLFQKLADKKKKSNAITSLYLTYNSFKLTSPTWGEEKSRPGFVAEG